MPRVTAEPGRSRPWAGGALLAATGAAMLAAALLGDPAPVAVPAQADRPVSARAGDRGDIRAHNSPTLARNPRRPAELAVTSRIDTPRFSCALRVSPDGGRSWRSTRVPIPAGEQRKCYAPDVAFGPDGTLYMSYVTLRGIGNVPNAVWLARSRDGGRTLEPPRRVAGPLAFQVRLAVDPAAPGTLYVTWLQAREVGPLRFTAPGNPIVASSSTDGGRTWSRPARVSSAARGRVLAGTPRVGRDGELYVAYLDLGDDRLDYEGGHDALGGPPHPGPFTLVVSRSRDRGATWEESVADDAIRPTRRFVAFLPPFPALAIDRRSGRIHVAFEDRRHGSADVHVWTLAPGASDWNGPVRLDDAPAIDRSAQYLPQLDVAPSGRLDVAYYDRRGDPRGRRTEVSLQSSHDDGGSFGERVRLSSRTFDGGIGAGSERGLPDPGSRIGLISGPADAMAAWSDTRAGTEASNKQEIRAARVTFRGGTRPGSGLWLGGGGLLLIAAGALLAARSRR